MSIASEISRLTTAKANIKSAIIAKGVSVPNEAKLDTYNTYVSQISGGGGSGGWQPPADWIDISSVNDNEINLLTSDGGVGVAFRITVVSAGTYSIDWGDGTIETARASGTIYKHQYIIGSGQSVNNGQYTCFKIRIYNATNTITRYETQRVSGYSRQQYSPLLWAVFGTQGITSYENAFYTPGTGIQCRELVACTIPTFVNCISTSYMLMYCSSLSSLTLPTSWGNVTNTSNMLSYCYSLRILNGIEFLGSQTVQSDFTDILRDVQALTGTITIGSLLTKIGIYGASGHNLLCTGIRLTNSGSTFTGSSPQVNVSYTNLDATALNQLFTDLPTLTGKTINITGSTGAGTCDKSIATAKGWTVTG